MFLSRSRNGSLNSLNVPISCAPVQHAAAHHSTLPLSPGKPLHFRSESLSPLNITTPKTLSTCIPIQLIVPTEPLAATTRSRLT